MEYVVMSNRVVVIKDCDDELLDIIKYHFENDIDGYHFVVNGVNIKEKSVAEVLMKVIKIIGVDRVVKDNPITRRVGDKEVNLVVKQTLCPNVKTHGGNTVYSALGDGYFVLTNYNTPSLIDIIGSLCHTYGLTLEVK